MPRGEAIDRLAIAERIVALRGVGKSKLALRLRTTVSTLDRVVDLEAAETTYWRILRRLEVLERQVAAAAPTAAMSFRSSP